MKIQISFSVFAILFFLSGPVSAAESFTIHSYVQKKGTDRSVLHLVARDVADHAGLCDYFVKDLHFDSSSRALNVQLQRETCFNDGYGKSLGDIYWRIPHALENERLPLTVTVNDTIAVLAFDPASGNFVIQGAR
jgi:hypothetical protein